MLSKKIKYLDFNGNEREEEFLFNLTQAEVMEMELSETGGLAESIKKVIAAQDAPKIIKIFKELILKAYGEKSADGKMFMKSEELSRNFSYTNAYSKLFMELATDDQAAAAFVNGIVPSDTEDTADSTNQKSLTLVE